VFFFGAGVERGPAGAAGFSTARDLKYRLWNGGWAIIGRMPLERYNLAVLSLADSTEHWKARLCNAANNILPLPASEFPKDLQERHTSLLKSVTLLAGDNGAINATVYQMKEKEGRAAISEIVAIWTELKSSGATRRGNREASKGAK
jgi:hypothetical protein